MTLKRLLARFPVIAAYIGSGVVMAMVSQSTGIWP